MSGVNTQTFTDATWDSEVLNSEVPVLVDFWAEWCGPCRMMSPTVDAIADAYVGRVKVGKLNVDDNGATGMRYNVRGIPTLLLKPRPHPLMPLSLQSDGIRAGQIRSLNPGEMLLQVADALALCRRLELKRLDLEWERELAEAAV